MCYNCTRNCILTDTETVTYSGDKACNVSGCNFDFPDCVNGTTGRGSSGRYSGSKSATEDRFFCAQGCPNSWLGDKVCDNKCRTASCGWDMGDCGVALVAEDFHGVTLLAPPSTLSPDVVSAATGGGGGGGGGGDDVFVAERC